MLDLGDYRLENPKTGFPQFGNCLVEADEPGLIGFVEYGECTRLQSSANCLLASSSFIYEY